MRMLFLVVALTVGAGVAVWTASGPNSDDSVDPHEVRSGRSADETLIDESDPLPSRNELSKIVRLPSIPFRNVTARSGVEFVHERGLSDERLLPETMGSGCASIHLNDDRLPDLLFVNSRCWDWLQGNDPGTATLSAWLNLGDMKFRDVTSEIGLDVSLYGMGAAVADFDNDGDDDLYVTSVGENRLMRNEQGMFRDVTTEFQVGGDLSAWSSSAGWFDYDNDGDPDLFVANYVKWSRELEQVVDSITFGGPRRFGSPDAYPPDLPYLFRNDGNRFTEIGRSVGLNVPTKSLGVAFVDFNRDDRVDIFVANDGVADQMWTNDSDGHFRDVGSRIGIAYGQSGAARAGMGVDIADFRNNGSHGIAVGQYENEMTALFVPVAPKAYQDEALSAGLGQDSIEDLTWGVRWADFDLDGRPDLVTTNGHVEESDRYMDRKGRYLQSAKIYWNAGVEAPLEFVPLSKKETGEDLAVPTSGRSMIVDDLDLDSDPDIVLATSGRAAQIFRNDCAHSNAHWLGIQLQGDGIRANRSGLGATVRLQAGAMLQSRLVSTARGYLSSGPSRVLFGLADCSTVEELSVTWPDGSRQVMDVTSVDRTYTIRYRNSKNELDSQQGDDMKTSRNRSSTADGHLYPNPD